MLKHISLWEPFLNHASDNSPPVCSELVLAKAYWVLVNASRHGTMRHRTSGWKRTEAGASVIAVLSDEFKIDVKYHV